MIDKENSVRNEDDTKSISIERKKRWEINLRRGLIELMILMQIRLRTDMAHGYGLISLIRETGVPELKAGTVYPLLKRMEEENLIESFIGEDTDQPGQPRRIYLITPLGEEMIDHMMKTYQSYNVIIKIWYQEILESRKRRRI